MNIIILCFDKAILKIIITQFLLFQVFVFYNIYLKSLLLKNIFVIKQLIIYKTQV